MTASWTLAGPDAPAEPIRMGFGRGLATAGEEDERVLALCADLTDSTQMHLFRNRFPKRFIQVGVAEQNLVTVAAGLAHAGYIPFTSSYAAFSPGRNWEQIKTTACLNDQPVKIVGSHAGLNVGPDGATHQMLEDIALMRVLPNMVVVAPADSTEAAAATLALARDGRPGYIRLARDATGAVFDEYGDFQIGRALLLREAHDIGVIATGTMTREALDAAELLAGCGASVAVLHVPTIKPLDEAAIVGLAQQTDFLVTIEEAQRVGGLGSAVAETVAQWHPTRVVRLGVDDRFGESGPPRDVIGAFGLDADSLAVRIGELWHAARPSDGTDPQP